MLRSHVIRPSAGITTGCRYPLPKLYFFSGPQVIRRFGGSIELWRAMALDREVILALEVRLSISLFPTELIGAWVNGSALPFDHGGPV